MTGTPFSRGGCDQPRTGIADPRKARVRDERDQRALPQPRQHLRGPLRFVVLVVADEVRPDVVAASSRRVLRVSSQRTSSAPRSAPSTRSVTSSRFPIGVAQTASGISSTAAPRLPRLVCVERLERDEGRSDDARSRTERAGTTCTRSRPGGSASRRITSRAGLEQEVVGRLAEAAADHDQLRVEDVDERAERRAEAPSDRVEHLQRTLLPLARAR